ncbi:2-C-methyl-D-erythritol 4-phosphate cytidylyltransferase [Sedimentitalea todarodis]|uniref:2-C-methyl-D-erythritol 4-phosphate cytidylyltransferase n=1 Tax=Sedimentitalea todarodis TaxID=1631240 RepID=A0ABU3VKA9_9RHOB|nr:2-C-methyl-D-erythritol 4-phosphate cytidylyltransferase [Sedimentitalea todarodis]MDU9006134.1 2-C-methyl-D-erythritol 4-phosphate cytidylyltransferase [Sedimentitalea todarodis]
MSVAVVIVAAGRGRRLGAETPKQYIPLGPTCALRRVAETFLSISAVRWIVPVIHPDDRTLCLDALEGLRDARLLPAVDGAETRAKSVRCGLEHLVPHGPELVLIHDAARPFLPTTVISGVIDALQHGDGACAALPLVDALWTSRDGAALAPVPRDGVWRAQTPQGFSFDKILKAHRNHDGTAADDVAVAREAGLGVTFVQGTERNYKITTADDLARATQDAEVLDAKRGGADANSAKRR